MNTTNRDPWFDDVMTSWLDSRSAGGDVDTVISRTLDRTRRMKPAPRWRLPGSWFPDAWQASIPRPPVSAPVLLVLALLVAVLLAVIAIGSQRRLPPPIGLAAPGRVVYVAAGDLWSANPDGSEARRMTSDDPIEGFPAHSPDGTMIAFKRLPADGAVPDWQSFGDIVVANVDGSGPRVVERMAKSPSPISWSSDSRQITYSLAVNGVDQVFAAEIVSTGAITSRQVTRDARGSWGPAFSPDGLSIAFVRGYPLIDGIWVARLDTNTERKVTARPFAQFDELMWSPDGQMLLFTAGDAGNHSIWTVPAGGGTEREPTHSVGHLTRAAWSPTGSRIAFLEQLPGRTNVRVMDADGSDPRTIGETTSGLTPRWSPDEARVLVVDAGSLTAPPSLTFLDPEGVRPPVTFEIPDYPGDANGRFDAPSWQRLAP